MGFYLCICVTIIYRYLEREREWVYMHYHKLHHILLDNPQNYHVSITNNLILEFPPRQNEYTVLPWKPLVKVVRINTSYLCVTNVQTLLWILEYIFSMLLSGIFALKGRNSASTQL